MKESPNIVLITVDQMRADLMGCAGHPGESDDHDRAGRAQHGH
jgi:arylsulfatase A-like enzyme